MLSEELWDIRAIEWDFLPSIQDSLRQLAQQWLSGDEHFWSFEEILSSLHRPEVRGYFAVERQESGPIQTIESRQWHGFLLVEIGPFSGELLYIHVVRGARRSGLGRALLKRLISDLKNLPSQEALFLEVRANNLAAQSLYRESGFVDVGRRPKYYGNGEDALVLKLDFLAGPL
jgi:ribosomal-protein-alanine N-acetyltransferase